MRERDTNEAFMARVAGYIGDPSGRDIHAPYAVSEAMIGMWADALLDDNPVYVDADAARATGRPGLIAPPTMIQAWTMPKLSRMAESFPGVPGFGPYIRPGSPTRAEGWQAPSELWAIMAEQGFSNNAATSSRQVYHRELIPGDHVTCTSTIESVSDRKRTAMGVGHFITTRLDYRDQADRKVATQHWTVLRFRTPTDAEHTEAQARRTQPARSTEAPPPAEPGDEHLVGPPRPGMRTSVTRIAITPIFVIATALATHDFYAIHHDVDWARSIGQPSIFSNILTTTGLVGGVMTRWGGAAVRLRSTDLRLLAPNYPGDDLSLQGIVTAVDGAEITMAVTGTNRIGTHVQATVTGSLATN